MPDSTPEEQRTKANGLINFMGRFGAILAFGAGSILYKSSFSEQAAFFSLTFFSLAFVMFAIPSGWMNGRMGKKKMLMIDIFDYSILFYTTMRLCGNN